MLKFHWPVKISCDDNFIVIAHVNDKFKHLCSSNVAIAQVERSIESIVIINSIDLNKHCVIYG